jgi:hypothetical protein
MEGIVMNIKKLVLGVVLCCTCCFAGKATDSSKDDKENVFPNRGDSSYLEKQGNSFSTKEALSPYIWLDKEVLDIKNIKEATETFITENGEWIGSPENCPTMVRYFQEIKQDDFSTVLKWLKLKDLKYFGVASTDKSADIDLIYPWYSEMEEKGIDIETEGLYKLIYLNAKATLHEIRFNKGDFPEEWLENHRNYHSLNFHYQKQY